MKLSSVALIKGITITGGLLALVSVCTALYWRAQAASKETRTYGYILIGFWVLAPPIWFWVEWVFLTKPHMENRVKHTHELARNIWLALIVVLAAILGIKWPPAE
ncbi:MAG TPA: hypothetical protein VGE41_03125 [Verrucomicrobiae bacterium]